MYYYVQNKPTLFCEFISQVQPGYVDYYFNTTQPWIHYVPVYSNLTNLIEIIEYVLDDKNGKQMMKIVRTANAWCQQKLTKNQMMLDMRQQLQSYAQTMQTSIDRQSSIGLTYDVNTHNLKVCKS